MARVREAVIDLGALSHNYAVAKRRAAGRQVIAVVKADAYGHGAVACARALRRAGCRALAVLSAGEMVELRDAGLAGPILILAGPQDVEEARIVAARRGIPVLHHRGQIEWVAAAARALGGTLPVHVEVDTGMRRMGVAPEEAPAFLAEVAKHPGLELAGVMTHYARADERDLGPTRAQQERFEAVMNAAGGPPGTRHVANSAGLLAAPGLPLIGDAVRPGLMLYGSRPGPHLGAELQPVMSLETEVVALRSVGRGESVGYGATWRAIEPGYVATLGLGYADGLPVSLSNVGEVGIAGRRAPLVGRVSMDSVGAWLGARPEPVGTRASFFGPDAASVEEVAAQAGTLSYELLVRVGARVSRRYLPDAATSDEE